jgi:putative addiction module component (TIGR02574 family)
MTQLSPDELERLSPKERLALIEQLWDSLDDADIPVTPAQEAELEHRLDDFERDRTHAVSWEQLKAELQLRRQ